MRRRRDAVPALDFVDALRIGWLSRRDGGRDELAAMADGFGFTSIEAMQAEAIRVRAASTSRPTNDPPTP